MSESRNVGIRFILTNAWLRSGGELAAVPGPEDDFLVVEVVDDRDAEHGRCLDEPL